MRLSQIHLDTVVSLEVAGGQGAEAAAACARAFAWFEQVERVCSRFDRESELARVCAAPSGRPVGASRMLLEAVQFALAVAKASGGAFDPTVGGRMEARGYDRNYRSGKRSGGGRKAATEEGASYRDVKLDVEQGTLTLLRPLQLDLGAVAKGMAVDMAARELRPWGSFAIDAGGDLYCGGRTAEGGRWRVGIRHPLEAGGVVETVEVCDQAVCTSANYERGGSEGGHLLDGRAAGQAPEKAEVLSATLIAPTAMAADALATAAFVLGPRAWSGPCDKRRLTPPRLSGCDAHVQLHAPLRTLGRVDAMHHFSRGSSISCRQRVPALLGAPSSCRAGLALLKRQGVDGVIFSSTMERHATF